MFAIRHRAGLSPPFEAPPAATVIEDVVTEEAGFEARPGRRAPKLKLLVEEGASVAQGEAVAHLHDAPDVKVVAAMPAKIGRIVFARGHRLAEIVLFHEKGGDIARHDTSEAETADGLRRLMQSAGAWPLIRRRPFGGMPPPAEAPAAIFVMASDTRPLAPDPRLAIAGREEDLARGLHALGTLTEGPVFLCQSGRVPILPESSGRIRVVRSGARHPQGLAGIRIQNDFPADIDAPVWDLHAEDAANIGTLLRSGSLGLRRIVRVSGPALRSERLVRTQPGADLRGLIRKIVTPGAHMIWSGSPLDGHPAHWLGPRDRQATVIPRVEQHRRAHWLVEALTRSASPVPLIPTAALDHSLGGAMPAAAFLRALSAGDDDAAMRFGVLSLLEEDLALADYVLGREANLPGLLRGMLERVRLELAA